MNYKVLCSDLDGTLLSTKNDVSEYTIAEIKRVRKAVRVILVSARMPSGMHYLQDRLGIKHQPMICYNGALILNGNRELFSHTIPSNMLWEIYGISLPLEVDLGLYVQDEWFVPKTSERVAKEMKYTKTRPQVQETYKTLNAITQRGAHKVMLMCTKESADKLMLQLKSILHNELHIYRSNDTLIELAPKLVSKRSAIAQLLQPRESMKDVMAFGDNYNDIEMIQAARCGVAVANARAEVKRIADHITLPNTENGVAHFISKHIII